MTPPVNPTDRERIIELEKRVKELEHSEKMSFGCFEMIADDLAFFDPKTDRSAVPPMMLNDWLRHVVREARSEERRAVIEELAQSIEAPPINLPRLLAARIRALAAAPPQPKPEQPK